MRTQWTPGFNLFTTTEGAAAFVARDLLDLSSHLLKPEHQQRLTKCLEAVFSLETLPAQAAQHAAQLEKAQYESIPVRWGGGEEGGHVCSNRVGWRALHASVFCFFWGGGEADERGR